MNSRQLYYAVQLSETGSFSALADKLGISQPALSKQILHLEEELGVRLFDRNTVPVTLTAAGEHFVKEAKGILYKEDQLLRSVEQFKSGERGTLTIGITPFRSAYLIPRVVKGLREKYPGVQVRLREAGSDVLRKEAAEGRFDLAVINLPADETAFDIIPIEADSLVLVVPDELLERCPELKGATQVEFLQCRNLPFVVVGPTQEMRAQFDSLCLASDVRPEIAAEVVGLTTAWQMACQGVGATLLPMQFVRGEKGSQPISVLTIRDSTYQRCPAVLTRKGQYISKFAKYAIELLKNGEN